MSEEDNQNKREAKEAEAGEQQPAVIFFPLKKLHFFTCIESRNTYMQSCKNQR